MKRYIGCFLILLFWIVVIHVWCQSATNDQEERRPEDVIQYRLTERVISKPNMSSEVLASVGVGATMQSFLTSGWNITWLPFIIVGFVGSLRYVQDVLQEGEKEEGEDEE